MAAQESQYGSCANGQIRAYVVYDDARGVGDVDPAVGVYTLENGYVLGARVQNDTTNMVANVRVRNPRNGEILTDEVFPSTQKSWNIPNSWGDHLAWELGLGYGCRFAS